MAGHRRTPSRASRLCIMTWSRFPRARSLPASPPPPWQARSTWSARALASVAAFAGSRANDSEPARSASICAISALSRIDGGFRVGDPPTQGSERHSSFRRGPPEIRASRPLGARCSVSRTAFGPLVSRVGSAPGSGNHRDHHRRAGPVHRRPARGDRRRPRSGSGRATPGSQRPDSH